jgi:hypothetical protein
MPSNGTPWTHRQEATLIELIDQGLSYEEAGLKMARSGTSVMTKLHRLGFGARYKGGHRTVKRVAFVKERWGKLTIVHMAAYLRITPAMVQMIATSIGLEMDEELKIAPNGGDSQGPRPAKPKGFDQATKDWAKDNRDINLEARMICAMAGL